MARDVARTARLAHELQQLVQRADVGHRVLLHQQHVRRDLSRSVPAVRTYKHDIPNISFSIDSATAMLAHRARVQ